MEVPFFLPTSGGDLSCVASIPAADGLLEPAVVLLPGDNARNRVGVLRDVARSLADRGQAVLRFDFPGSGFSPIEAPPSRKELLPFVLEAVDRFREASGATSVAVAGTCMGARASLMIAARLDGVVNAVAVGCPIRKRKPVRPKIRAGLAAVDAIGGKIAGKLARGARTKVVSEGWHPGLTVDLERAVDSVRIEMIYGELDEFYGDFTDLLESDDLVSETKRALVVTTLPGQQLRGLMSVEHHGWVRDQLIESLSLNPARTAGGS